MRSTQLRPLLELLRLESATGLTRRRFRARFRSARRGRTGFVRTAMPERAQSVLDIGCGEGWLIGELGRVSRRTGVDIDPEILDRARGRYPDCEFLEIDGAALPFPDEDFDAVVLSEVIEHVGDDKKGPTMDEAMRVLKIGGLLILTAPHRGIFSFADPLDVKRRYPILYHAYQRRANRQPLTPAEIGHKHVTLAELDRLLRGDAEFELVEYSGPAAPIGDFLLAAFLVLPRIPSALIWRAGAVQSWAASLPAPRLLASDIRIVTRKTR